MTVVAIIGAMPPYGQASVQYTFNGSGSVQGPIGRFERTADTPPDTCGWSCRTGVDAKFTTVRCVVSARPWASVEGGLCASLASTAA